MGSPSSPVVSGSIIVVPTTRAEQRVEGKQSTNAKPRSQADERGRDKVAGHNDEDSEPAGVEEPGESEFAAEAGDDDDQVRPGSDTNPESDGTCSQWKKARQAAVSKRKKPKSGQRRRRRAHSPI